MAQRNADFFAPAAPHLGCRAMDLRADGNRRRICSRAGLGCCGCWGRCRTNANAPCAAHLALYSGAAMPREPGGVWTIADAPGDQRRRRYGAGVPPGSFARSLAGGKAPNLGLLLHRPGVGGDQRPASAYHRGTRPLIEVSDGPAIARLALMLAVYIHTFEAIQLRRAAIRVPPQWWRGSVGDNLDPDTGRVSERSDLSGPFRRSS